MKRYKIAVLDDYQNAAMESADWSVLRDRADIPVFQDHLVDPDALIERLQPFDVVCVMRERSPLPRNVIERLPNLILILGPRIAHSLLPLGKKAGSGWNYAVVPIVGPLLGAALAGIFVRLVHF